MEPTFLFRFCGPAAIYLPARFETQLAGEAILDFPDGIRAGAEVRVVRVAIVAGSVEVAGRQTGRFAMTWEGATVAGQINPGAVGLQLTLKGSGLLRYTPLAARSRPLDDRFLPSEAAPERERLPETVVVKANVSARLSLTPGRAPQLLDARVRTYWNTETLSGAIEIAVAATELIPLPGLLSPVRSDTGGIVESSRIRRLACQPFVESGGDPAVVGDQFAKAAEIWKKACVEIVPLAPRELAPAEGVLDLRRAARMVDDRVAPNVIPVFFVSNVSDGDGGGLTTNARDAVAVALRNGNPVLLAHELGHVLGLKHQDADLDATGTVMQPSMSASLPGSDRLSRALCGRAQSEALETTDQLCFLTPDFG